MPILKFLSLRRAVPVLAVLLALGLLVIERPTAQSGSALVQPHHLVYEGAFRLPGQSGPGGPTGDWHSFNGGGEAITLSESRTSLFLTGSRCCADPADAGASTVAEVTIPEVRNVSSLASLATAAYIQPHADAVASRQGDIGCRGPIGGLLPWGGKLIISAYCYYDAAYAQIKSHFTTTASALGTNVTGPAEIQSPVAGGGRAGFVSGYMTTIPAEWQAAFGGNALAGNCCIPIITRTSWGPSISVINASDVGVVDPVPAKAVLGYTNEHHPLGDCTEGTISSFYTCATSVTGVIFPSGTSSVLFFGTHGVGAFCYGPGTNDPALHLQPSPVAGEHWCYDLANGAKGTHAFPYVHYVWAFDANDLVAVKNGTKAMWDVRPYASWAFDTPFEDVTRGVRGATFDPVSRRVFVSIGDQDGPKPLVQVFRLDTGTAPPPADTVAPTVSLASPTNGSAVTGTSTFSAAASDNVGVAGVWFTVDGSTVGAEDTTAPYQLSWNSSGVANGSHVVRAFARDAAGNTAGSGVATVSVTNTASADTTAPTVSLTSPSTGATVNGLVTLAASASDNVGVASVQFWINGSLAGTVTAAPYSMGWNTAVAANAAHTVSAVARDAAGNAGTSQTVSVTVNNAASDTTDPSVSLTSPAGGTTVAGTVTLTAAASDNVGLAGVEFFIDGNPLGAMDTTAPYQVPWVTTSATNGARTVQARAIDTSGNDQRSALLTVNVANVPQDTTPPTVSVTSPASGSTVSGTVSVAAAAAASSGIAGVQFTLDGVNVGAEDTVAPYAYSWNTAGTANGSHTLRAVARNASGTVSTSVAVAVTVNNTSSDTTLPTVSVTAPSQNAVVANIVPISASASDNVAVVSVQFTIDDVAIGAPDTTAPYGVNWTTNGIVNGYHTLRAVARDAAGNTRTSSGRSVYVSNSTTDTAAPTITISAPSNGSTLTGTVDITAAGSDNVGVLGVQFAIDGVAVGPEDTAAPFSQPWVTSGALNRNYVLTATARDAAGNRSTSAGVTVRVKNLGKGKSADLNDDGFPDLLLSHDTGRQYAWFMRSGALVGESAITPDTVNTVWEVAGMEDFNGDKKADFVWQHAVTGQVYFWFMDRGTLVGEFGPLEAGTWKVAAIGDLNGDGRADIVWRSPASELHATLMNGTTAVGDMAITPTTVDPAWRIAGASDLNEDGKADLVWQNDVTGGLAYWFMNGGTATASGALWPTAGNVAWQVKAVDDFDGDGSADLVFQHASSGQLYIWYMDGTRLVRDGFLSPSQVRAGWRIVGGR